MKMVDFGSNQPISCRGIARNDNARMRHVNSFPALAKVNEEIIWNSAPAAPMRKIE